MQGGTATADGGETEQLARSFEHRVGFFARRVARSWMLGDRFRDELVSAGYWGLAVALHKRRPDASPREFSAYVSRRIEGAVLDEARQCLQRAARRDFAASGPAEVGDAEEEGASPDAWADPGPCPEQSAFHAQARERVAEILSELDPEARRMLEAWMGGESLREIADREGVALGTLRTRFGRSLRRLRARTAELRRAVFDED